jgi:hypothetical protein
MNELIAKIEQWAEDRKESLSKVSLSSQLDAMRVFHSDLKIMKNGLKPSSYSDQIGDIFFTSELARMIIIARYGVSGSIFEFLNGGIREFDANAIINEIDNTQREVLFFARSKKSNINNAIDRTIKRANKSPFYNQ